MIDYREKDNEPRVERERVSVSELDEGDREKKKVDKEDDKKKEDEED